MKILRSILYFITCLMMPLTHGQTLVIATTPNSPPFASMIDKQNHFMGFEIDIMEGICQRIKASCQYKPIIVSDIAPALASNTIDLAIASIIIPNTPLDNFIYSLPYLQSNAQFMTSKSSSINTPKDIRAKRVGVRRGTLYGGSLFKDIALNIYDKQLTIIDYPAMPELLSALDNNAVDIVFTNAATVRYWGVNHSSEYKLIGTKIPVGDGYGIMAKKGHEELMAQINRALLSMEADGSYLAIYTRYF